MKVLKLDPPLNLAGLSILRTAERGMNPPLLPMEVNERAERMQESIADLQATLNPADDDPLTPGRALMILCRRFLEQYPVELDADDYPDEDDEEYLAQERAALVADRCYWLDQIAENINGQPGWDTPYPTTARELDRRIYGLLDASGKQGRLAELLDGMNMEDLDGETLEGIAASLSECGGDAPWTP